MENPNISTPSREEKLEPEKPEFNKNDFTITLEGTGDGLEMFIQKSADTFVGLGKIFLGIFVNTVS